MSQQHMQSDSDYSPEPTSYAGGYREEPSLSSNYSPNTYGQKLPSSYTAIDTGLSAAQRLALAIVSLSLFAFIVLLFAILGFTPLARETGSFIGTGFGILVLYSVVAVIINVVFNRRR